jgi:hypothetical protein
MGGDKGALDLRQEDAEIFDRLMADVLRDAIPRVVFDVDFWTKRMEVHTVGSEHYIRAKQRHDEAKAKLDDGVRRLRRCIPSRVVPCSDGGCKGHHATFVGIA